MISAKKTQISLRSIEFSGVSELPGQARGENTLVVNYHSQTKIVDPKTLRQHYVTVADKSVKFNMQFADKELYDKLVEVKILAIKLLEERHKQEALEIEDALGKINRDTTESTESNQAIPKEPQISIGEGSQELPTA